MAEIIDLDQKKKLELVRRDEEERSRRMELMLQMFHCSLCTKKCMKCGSQLELASPSTQTPSIPYRLCENCVEQYQEFLERLHGRGNPKYYWCNQEWMEIWKAWMNYQETLKRYELSEGFRRLLEELKGRRSPLEE
jgi:hypothetical protein